jgi:deoxyribodipyrimidine photo-lyase
LVRVLHWFRKDLRLDDNTALAAAHAASGGDVVTTYISEPTLLARPDMAAVRMRFVLESLADLSRALREAGGGLILRHGDAGEELARLARETGAKVVHANAEYEPDLAARDREVTTATGRRRHHDAVAPRSLPRGPGRFAERRRRTIRRVYAIPTRLRGTGFAGRSRPNVTRLSAPRDTTGAPLVSRRLATLEDLGMATDQDRWPGGAAEGEPRSHASSQGSWSTTSPTAIDSTGRAPRSYRTISASARSRRAGWCMKRHARWNQARTAAAGRTERRALHLRAPLARFLRPRDASLPARRDRRFQEALRPAALGERRGVLRGLVRRTNRLSGWWMPPCASSPAPAGCTIAPGMIVASFLTKDLLVDWRRGERWFMNHLVDGDPASNNGGWQWAAGTGTDAQPYFRIFNPVLQGKRFDPDGNYVRQWVPELTHLSAEFIHEPWRARPMDLAAAGVVLGETYPEPICDHAERRKLALALYGEARGNNEGGT